MSSNPTNTSSEKHHPNSIKVQASGLYGKISTKKSIYSDIKCAFEEGMITEQDGLNEMKELLSGIVNMDAFLKPIE